MQTRSYNQLIDRLREVEVPSFEATSQRFAASASVSPATGLGASSIQVAAAALVIVLVGIGLWFANADESANSISDRIAAKGGAVNFATAHPDDAQTSGSTKTSASIDASTPSSVMSKGPAPSSTLNEALASATQVDVDQANAEHSQLADSPSDASELSVAEGERDIAIVEPQHLARSLSTDHVARYAVLLPIDQYITPADWRLTFATAFGTPVANTSGRAILTRDLGSGFSIGLAGGMGYKRESESRFAGFRDTLIESSTGSTTSRIGQFDQQEVSKPVYHGAAVMSFEPGLLQLGVLQAGIQVLTGFVASDFMVEPSATLRIDLYEGWMIYGSTGASMLPLSSSTPDLTASFGLSTRF